MEDIPTSLCPYNGRVLVGVGRLLRIYDLGKKKLLRKCENKVGCLNCCIFIWFALSLCTVCSHFNSDLLTFEVCFYTVLGRMF